MRGFRLFLGQCAQAECKSGRQDGGQNNGWWIFVEKKKEQLKKAESRLADWDSVGVDYFLLDPDLEKRNQIRILSSSYRSK